jgi:hypothetical protein
MNDNPYNRPKKLQDALMIGAVVGVLIILVLVFLLVHNYNKSAYELQEQKDKYAADANHQSVANHSYLDNLKIYFPQSAEPYMIAPRTAVASVDAEFPLGTYLVQNEVKNAHIFFNDASFIGTNGRLYMSGGCTDKNDNDILGHGCAAQSYFHGGEIDIGEEPMKIQTDVNKSPITFQPNSWESK